MDELTVTIAPDGRTWYGKRRYRLRIEGIQVPVDMPATPKVSYAESVRFAIDILKREGAAGRSFTIVDKT